MPPSDQPKNDRTDRTKHRRCVVGCLQRDIGADYTDDERELLVAVDRYKRKHQRVFLTCREMLVIVQELGYTKLGCSAQDDPNPNLYLCGCHSVCYSSTRDINVRTSSELRASRVKPMCPIHRLPLAYPTNI